MVSCECADDESRRRIGQVLRDFALECRTAGQSAWIILSTLRAAEVRDILKPNLATGETALVALLAGHAAWHGFSTADEDWLLAHL